MVNIYTFIIIITFNIMSLVDKVIVMSKQSFRYWEVKKLNMDINGTSRTPHLKNWRCQN